MNSIVKCQGVSKSYTQGNKKISVLQDINFELESGQSVAIVGASGSGKSTLLSLLGGLDSPTAGTIVIADCNLATYTETQRSELRNYKIGFVYQFHHLLAEFTALENVAMPLFIRGTAKKIAVDQAAEYLAAVGLSERLTHTPSQLSGGERQRVAIARALVTQPTCVLMDEPTGNLDQQTAASIHQLISELGKKYQMSFIVVTHDMNLAKRISTVRRLDGGQLI